MVQDKSPVHGKDGANAAGEVPQEPDPALEEMLKLQLMSGPWVFQAIYVAAELGLADLLGDDPVPAARLADQTASHRESLYRFCRALAGLGLLAEHPEEKFTLTPLGATLRSDHAGTLRYATMLHGAETFRAWADVLHTVRTGRPAFEHVFDMPFFAYLEKNPTANATFARVMGDTDQPPAVLRKCDFSKSRLIVDVGGGTGTLLATALKRAPGARGILLDVPATVREAPANLARHGVADRCEIVGGSFFEDMPGGGDTYILSRVLHDWDDQHALSLLQSVRAAMTSGGRVIVIDHLLPDASGFHPGLLSDLHMLVILGGRDRTEPALRRLIESAGFQVAATHRSGDKTEPRAQSVIEAVSC